MANIYKHPTSGRVEHVGEHPWLWVLLFGFFYFAYKGAWAHAVLGIFLAAITFGFSWLLYPFFARSIMKAHYERAGWVPQVGYVTA